MTSPRFLKKVNALDDNKTSALHYAARHDNQRAVELLLSWGADVNLKGNIFVVWKPIRNFGTLY